MASCRVPSWSPPPADDPPPVPGLDVSCRNGIRAPQPGVQDVDALRRELTLQPGPNSWVGRRDLKVVERCPDIEARAADEDRLVPAGTDAGQVQPGLPLVCRNAGLPANLQDVELMVGDPATLLDRELGRADVHAPIELHGIGIDDLAPEPLGEGEGEV